jgi:hypothetical protein
MNQRAVADHLYDELSEVIDRHEGLPPRQVIREVEDLLIYLYSETCTGKQELREYLAFFAEHTDERWEFLHSETEAA